jgi:hypothetical protein
MPLTFDQRRAVAAFGNSSTSFTHRLISTMNIHPLRPRDHEDAARVAISWLAECHRTGWRSAFEALLDIGLMAA